MMYQHALQICNWLSSVITLDPSNQDKILEILDLDPVLTSTPLRHDYVTRLLKQLVAAAEEAGQQLSDSLVERYTECLFASQQV